METDHPDLILDYNTDLLKIDNWSENVITSTKGIAPDAHKLGGRNSEVYVYAEDNIVWQPTIGGISTIGIQLM